VLEGGQTKEDSKRNEIFWNETLAPDQIDRLLDPKALTNFKKFDENGEHEIHEFSPDDNYVIKGNNLLALHSLKKVFSGKVKLIYIDPPYNTGNDDFGYNDRFNHSAWLTFMKNRIQIARDLLSKDGSLWINIDDDEAHYLKVLADEVFKRENFVSNIVWQKKYTVANDARYFSDNHDHILVYAKNLDSFEINGLERTEDQNKRYTNPDDDPKGPWMSQPLHAKSGNVSDFSYTFKNGVTWSPPRGTYPRYTKESLREFEKESRMWFGSKGDAVPRVKKYLSKMGNVTPATIWFHDEVGNNDQANKEVKRLVTQEEFSTPKPEKLLKRIVHIGSKEGDLVLDFFAGSGTTGAVAHKMGRRYILCEQMDYVEDVTLKRLQKVIEGEQGGISEEVEWQGGGSFVYAELMEYNAKFVKEIEAADSKEDLQQIWVRMQEHAFLSYKVNPADIDSEKASFDELTLNQQKQLLIELLDKNQLYVNYSEIEDEDYGISNEEQKQNHQFYKLK
jgi:adenine-specific DNA-methyltransferase